MKGIRIRIFNDNYVHNLRSNQGSKGIRQRPLNNVRTSPMMIHNITTKKLDEATNQNSLKVPKVVKLTNKKTLS